MGLLGSIFVETLAGVAVAGAEGFAQHRAAQGAPPQQRGPKSESEGCTPCAALAMVEDARAAAGFGPPQPPPRKRRKPQAAKGPKPQASKSPKRPPKPPAKKRRPARK